MDDDLKGVFWFIAGVTGFILVLVGLAWVFTSNDLAMYSYFAPKYEATRRHVFEQSHAYQQGNYQELEDWVLQWKMAKDPQVKMALASQIIIRYGELPQDAIENMPLTLASDIETVRNYKVQGGSN